MKEGKGREGKESMRILIVLLYIATLTVSTGHGGQHSNDPPATTLLCTNTTHPTPHMAQTVQQELSFLKQIEWAAMVIDEAHRLKNSATQVRASLNDLNVDFTVLLTGTCAR